VFETAHALFRPGNVNALSPEQATVAEQQLAAVRLPENAVAGYSFEGGDRGWFETAALGRSDNGFAERVLGARLHGGA
jgi:hypothetical protein